MNVRIKYTVEPNFDYFILHFYQSCNAGSWQSILVCTVTLMSDDYWKGTIGQRIAQDRQMWKQHAEAFAQPRDTMAAQ